MNTERDTVVQVVVSTAVVVLFTLVILIIGVRYYTDRGFEPLGAIALVGAVAGFVIVMSLAGYFIVGR